MNKTGIIYGVNGPVIYLKGDPGFKISEMVYVGPEKLVGEVIGLKKGMTTVQVFEETTGLKPGDTVMGTGDAISVLLGPGIIHNIFDGIQRPLEEIAKSSGKYISRGVSVDSLDTAKKWDVHVTVKVGFGFARCFFRFRRRRRFAFLWNIRLRCGYGMFGLIRFIGLFGGLCRLPGFRNSLRLFGADRIRFRRFFLLFRLYFLHGFRRCFNLLAFLSRRRFGFRGALNTLRKRKRLWLIFIRRGIVAACKHDQQKSQ